MSKTTFQDRFQKTKKFYDNAYHHHKSTFKGLSQFFRSYGNIQKDYATQILRLGEGINGFFQDFTKQLAYIQAGVREICGYFERISQIHFNFGQRLREIGDYCKDEYNVSKKKKQVFMKLNIERSQQQHETSKDSKNRSTVQNKQKQICKRLHDSLNQFMQDQTNRTQKLKQQLIIYFSLCKKVSQKSFQLSTSYNIKMAQNDFKISVAQIDQIQDLLILQFNGYGEDKIIKKQRQNLKVTINRQSLRQSLKQKEKVDKLNSLQQELIHYIDQFKKVPEQFNYPDQKQQIIGLFDKNKLTQYKRYTREFNSTVIKQLAFAYLNSYCKTLANDQINSLLSIIKINLKIKQIDVGQYVNPSVLLEKFSLFSQNHKTNVYLLIRLSQYYDSSISLKQLNESFRISDVQLNTTSYNMNQIIKIVFIDTLLQSLIILKQGYSILYDQYVDIIKIMIDFSKKIFNFPPNIIIALLFKKLIRAFSISRSMDNQNIQQLIDARINYNQQNHSTDTYLMQIGHAIIKFLTKEMSKFYSCCTSLNNLIKISFVTQNILPKNYFSSIQHLHKCIKLSGYNFFNDADSDKKMTTSGIWRGEQRLKNITQVLQQIQYNKIYDQFLDPLARQLSKIMGVGYQIIFNKMKKQFSDPAYQIIKYNLLILNQQDGIDREGYVLRLGISLSHLDMSYSRSIEQYDCYFNVLEKYLMATQKDYDQLLDHSRRTELWIVQQNSQATQNCIDFCSLLYKPFQFLLTSLKKLQEQPIQTEFMKKYNNFIKVKLNNALKGQIQKYIKFLDDSLNIFTSEQPELSLKSKKYGQIQNGSNQQLSKERYTYKQITRRIYNLTFLKQQLDQIVCDFIDKDIYKEINYSIFNLDLLQKIANKANVHRELLLNILEIATSISKSQELLTTKIAKISVYYFMKRIFNNLYYQQQKGFFFNDKDYKLSQYTFVKMQNQLQQIFSNISRNIPIQILDNFSTQFCNSFVKAYKNELLNVNKLKLPINKVEVTTYLFADLGFLCNLVKQKFLNQELVKNNLNKQCEQIIKDMDLPSQKIMQNFSEASLKNNNQQSKYLLALLNLRRQQKAEQFVLKFKKLLK